MAPPARLLVLAIDAASPRLLERWAADGTLPVLGGLVRDGLLARTRSVEWLYGGATWPSFYTGTDVARHGLYWVDRLRPGTYELATCGPEEFGRRRAVWDVLGDAGRRVAVMDVPLSRLAPRLTGIQVVGWGDHDAVFELRTTPPELRVEIEREVGRHPAPRRCDTPHRTTAEYRAFTDQLVRGAGLRGRLTRRLLGRGPWDFAIQVFSEVHCAGHQCWHFHDASHPGYDPEAARATGDLVREVYAAVDRAIGEVLAGVPPDTTVVVTTLHDMAAMSGGKALLPAILERLGAFAPETAPPLPRRGSRERLSGLVASAWRRLPAGARAPFEPLRRRAHGLLDPPAPPATGRIRMRAGSSRCFPLETGYAASGIRLNLAGREPEGVLRPGPEADAFVDDLIAALTEVVDSDTGRPLIPSARRTAEVFRGEYLDELPDVLVAWDQDRLTGSTHVGTGRGATLRATSPRIGRLEGTNTYCRSGEHRSGGWLVARGPGLRPGRMHRDISILDLAPTFARMLGCDMPDTDGEVIPELAGVIAPGNR